MIRFLVGLCIFISLLANPALAKRVALVIGNADYKFVTPLLNPINDATLIEAALKKAGFEVIRRDNLDQQAMRQAMIDFSRTLKRGAEAGMFYYAGHGIEINGKNYLVPIDSNMQSKEEADIYNFDVNNFMATMENSGVPFNIMVLDACRNNPFRSMRSTGGGLAPMLAPAGSYVAYATAPGAVAADGEGKNSPFSEALASAIAIPGLPMEEVFKQTRTKVRIATDGAQVPFDSSAIEGSFYFTAPVEVTAAPVLASVTDHNAEAKAAFAAADDDIDMLGTVAAEFSDTAWGKLATSKIKSINSKLAAEQPEEFLEPKKPSVKLSFPFPGKIRKWELSFQFKTKCENDLFASLVSPSGQKVIIMDRGLKRCSGSFETFDGVSSSKDNTVFHGREGKGDWAFELIDLDNNAYTSQLIKLALVLTVFNNGKTEKHRVNLKSVPLKILQRD